MFTSHLVGMYEGDIDSVVYNKGEEIIEGLDEGLLPDVILLDINMPIMGGFEFLNIYEDYAVKAKVFLLSSSVNEEDRKQAEKYSCVAGYYTKPISKESVHEMLRSAEK